MSSDQMLEDNLLIWAAPTMPNMLDIVTICPLPWRSMAGRNVLRTQKCARVLDPNVLSRRNSAGADQTSHFCGLYLVISSSVRSRSSLPFTIPALFIIMVGSPTWENIEHPKVMSHSRMHPLLLALGQTFPLLRYSQRRHTQIHEYDLS